MRTVFARGALLALLAACGDEPARVRLAPISPCGQVTDETGLRVVAYTPRGELRRGVPPLEIDAFPADTEQLGVEVIGESGRLAAVGKSAPLDFGGLPDAAAIPIVMAPLDGLCPVGPMTESRQSPVVALAGDGVLVVGGTGADGSRLATAELYDRATATFSPVALPSSLLDPDNGLAGVVLTELPDGRVALTGTANHALAIFDPSTRRFSTPSLFDHRAYHGALAVASDRLLVIGGCADVVAGACSGPSLRTGFVYDLTDVTERERGPALDPSAIRYGASVWPLGVSRDGATRYVLAGGFGEPGAADRFALDDEVAERITGVHAQLAALDGGALLTAFAPDGAAPSGVAGVLPPDAAAIAPIAPAPAIGNARLVQLEDGSVLAVGDQLARYRPTSNTWTAAAQTGSAPGPLNAPSLVRLRDGSVLVLGGAATAEAWVYRPSLVGESAGSVTVVPDGNGDDILTAPDPTTVDRTGGTFALVSSDDALRARALVGGPRASDAALDAVVRVLAGGVALIAQQTGPGEAVIGQLVPGESAQIIELAGGARNVLCSGPTVSEAELAIPVGLAIDGGIATLSVGPPGDATVKARCELRAVRRGAWGIAAAGTGARVELGPITFSRAR